MILDACLGAQFSFEADGLSPGSWGGLLLPPRLFLTCAFKKSRRCCPARSKAWSTTSAPNRTYPLPCAGSRAPTAGWDSVCHNLNPDRVCGRKDKLGVYVTKVEKFTFSTLQRKCLDITTDQFHP